MGLRRQGATFPVHLGIQLSNAQYAAIRLLAKREAKHYQRKCSIVEIIRAAIDRMLASEAAWLMLELEKLQATLDKHEKGERSLP